MNWHPEALSRQTLLAAEIIRQRQAWRGFYLAGGTGLALWLGHRISNDLYFFSQKNTLQATEREQLLSKLRGVSKTIEQHKDGCLQLMLQGVSTVFLHYPYPLIGKKALWEGIPVTAVEDIALMKISAIIGRGTKRDFVDLYAIAQKWDLRSLLLKSPRKYKEFNNFLTQASYALVYFKDADKDKMPRLIQPYDWSKVKNFFSREIPKLFQSFLK